VRFDMKVVCPSCERLVDVTSAQVRADEVLLRCPRCGVSSALTVAGHLEAQRDHQESPSEAEQLSQDQGSFAQSARDQGSFARSAQDQGSFAGPGPGQRAAVQVPVTPFFASRKTPGARHTLASSSDASNVVMLRSPSTAAIDSAKAQAASAPFAVPDGVCPRCLAKRAEHAAACSACGLSFSGTARLSFEPPESLKGPWVELLEHWGDDGRHEALRRLAIVQGHLAELGRLYRLRLAHHADDPWAVKGRDEVFAAASAVLLTARVDTPAGMSPALKLVVGGVCVVVIIGALTLMVKVLASLGS
jgi:predicted Zn finger-like uncharacterized protein